MRALPALARIDYVTPAALETSADPPGASVSPRERRYRFPLECKSPYAPLVHDDPMKSEDSYGEGTIDKNPSINIILNLISLSLADAVV